MADAAGNEAAGLNLFHEATDGEGLRGRDGEWRVEPDEADRTVTREQFAELRMGGEWFSAAPELLEHCRTLRGDRDPWQTHVRWFAAELRRTTP